MLNRNQDSSEAGSGGPIDLAHLARQTLGDPELRREVVDLFLAQAAAARRELDGNSCEATRAIAHGLVGAARAVGAFTLARRAEEVEASPDSPVVLLGLFAAIDEVREFFSQRQNP